MPTSARYDVGSEATRAAMNDSPVDCQNREWTEPQRDHRPLHTPIDGGEASSRNKITPIQHRNRFSVAVFFLFPFSQFTRLEMAFLLFLYFYSQKSIFYLSKSPETSDFHADRGQKRLFHPYLGGSFRPVAQKFRPMAKILFLLPFMS